MTSSISRPSLRQHTRSLKVSYREPSTDVEDASESSPIHIEDEVELQPPRNSHRNKNIVSAGENDHSADSATLLKRNRLRKSTRRGKTSYQEPLTDAEDELHSPPPKRHSLPRATRVLRSTLNQDTPSEASSSSDDHSATPLSYGPPPSPHRSFPTKRKPRSFAGPGGNGHHLKLYKRQKTISTNGSRLALHQKDKPADITILIPSRTHRIPKWQNLPPHVLLSIMQNAAYPLYTGASRDSGGVRWLLNTSELCLSFHDACIAALMHSPPLFPAHRARWLLYLLKASARDYGDKENADNGPRHTRTSGRMSLDYRKKIKRLEIEVNQILVKKGGIDLDELLIHTPLVKDIRLYHNFDTLSDRYIWAHPIHGNLKDRWSYGHLFDLLSEHGINLHSFEWNERFLRDDPLLASFGKSMSQSSCLRSLEKLSLRNMMLPDMENLNELVVGANASLQTSIVGLDQKAAKLMTWRSTISDALGTMTALQDLTLSDCSIFNDETIGDLPGGLTRLELRNCAFVRSEGLHMYLSKKGASLLSLVLQSNQSISLDFLRHLNTSTPRLQELDVDMTYYDPTSYKDTEPLFDELLPNGPPTWPSTLQSISIGPLRNLTAEDAESFYQSLVDASNTLPHLRTLILRTLLNQVGWRDRAALRQKWENTLVQTFHCKYNADLVPPSMTESASASQSRKSTRIQSFDSPADASSLAGSGRCNVVLFELSDQRPAQDQFTEGDFLDEPEDDDGEWNGRDEIQPPKYSSRRYAW